MNFSPESPLPRRIGYPQLGNGYNGSKSIAPSNESVNQNDVCDTMASSSTNSNDDFAEQNQTNAVHQSQIYTLRDSSADEWRRQMLHNANDLAALSIPEVRRRPRPKCFSSTTSLKLNGANNKDDSYTTNILVSKVRADAKAKLENHLNVQENSESPSIGILVNNWKQSSPESCASEGGVDICPSSPSIASISLTSSSHATSPSFISSPDGYFAHHYFPKTPPNKNGHVLDDSDLSFSSTNAMYAINPCSSSSLSSIYQTPKPVAQMNSSCIENETESAIPCSKLTELFSPKSRISKATSLQSFNSSSMSPLLSSARYLDFAQQEINFDIVDLQSVLAMEWLRNTALMRLTKMVDQTVVEKSQEKQRHKKLSMLKTLRRSIRQRVEAKDDINTDKYQENACNELSGLYGTPLSEISSKTDDGNPLPRFVTDIMDFLMLHAANAEGIFRKNGVKLRIEEIKLRCSKLNPNDPVPEDLLSKSQLHDLADALKQYFRLLPECLMTHSVSIMLENAISELPSDKHFLAINYCMLLLPTENRESLQLLLKFLYKISKHSSTNQMTSDNLATCFMPSLFSFPTRLSRSPSKFLRRTAEGLPSEREIKSYSVVKTALTKMIDEQGKIFRIPKEMSRELSHCAQWDLDCDLRIATKNGILEFPDQMHRYFRKEYMQLIKGHLDNWKGWNLRRIFPDGTHIFSKSPSDGIPLPLFLIRIKIPNIPINMILHSILYNRHFLEQNVDECQRIGTSGHNFDLIKVSYRTIEESVQKTAYLARRWSYAETRGTESFCCLVERSVVPRNARRVGPRVNFLKSAFLISSMPGEDSALLSYCCRVDLRGRPKHWYDKVHAETLVQNLYRLRESLSKPLYSDIPPTM